MSANIYDQLEKLVLPNLLGFKEDLTTFDKNLLKEYSGKFLYGYRDSGTNILCLDKDTFDYSLDKKEIHDFLEKRLSFLCCNNNYLYFNGESFEEIDLEKLTTIFIDFRSEVLNKKDFIDSLDIDLIVLELYCLMRDSKSKWRSIAINSDIPSRRRFRNHFKYEKIKIPKDFKKISAYHNIEISDEFKNIKKQLLENLS